MQKGIGLVSRRVGHAWRPDSRREGGEGTEGVTDTSDGERGSEAAAEQFEKVGWRLDVEANEDVAAVVVRGLGGRDDSAADEHELVDGRTCERQSS